MKPIQFRGKETMSYNKAEHPLPPAEGAEEILNKLLGNPGDSINVNSYQIKPLMVDGKAEWWIVHHGVGSGEPLAQWLNDFATLQNKPQPTAEGAEEILDRLYSQFSGKRFLTQDGTYIKWDYAIAAMHKFATIHAQRVADKMVSERLREMTERCKKLEFMIDNGLGWDDMRNDITMPHEL